MSHTEVQILDAINAQGNGLRAEFFRSGARWAHRLLAAENRTFRPLLESVEGDDREPFPPSPALQQLAIQQQDDNVMVALLVGMAGKNHWSVGVEAFPEKGRIRFDVACRNQRDKVGYLGNRYKAVILWETTQTRSLVATTQRFQYELDFQPPGREANIDVAGPADGLITLHVVVDRSLRTQRWCYEFQQTPLPRP